MPAETAGGGRGQHIKRNGDSMAAKQFRRSKLRRAAQRGAAATALQGSTYWLTPQFHACMLPLAKFASLVSPKLHKGSR